MLDDVKMKKPKEPDLFKGAYTRLDCCAPFLQQRYEDTKSIIIGEIYTWVDLAFALERQWGDIDHTLKVHDLVSQLTYGQIKMNDLSSYWKKPKGEPGQVSEKLIDKLGEVPMDFELVGNYVYNLHQYGEVTGNKELIKRFVGSSRALDYHLSTEPLIDEDPIQTAMHNLKRVWP